MKWITRKNMKVDRVACPWLIKKSGAISRDTLLHNLRAGEISPSARTNEQEKELIRKEKAPKGLTTDGHG